MGWIMSSARLLRGHQFGNAVLSRFPITQHLEHDLSWKTCEPRRLQRVDVSVNGATLHVYNVHLGTALLERRHQAERLAAIVTDRHVPGPKLVLGDFNEWMKGLVTSTLSARLNSVDLRNFLQRRRTYPGVFPLLHLDHIYYAGHVEIVGIELPRTRLALVASDHLPLVADVRGRDEPEPDCSATDLAFFFVLFFFGRAQAGRRAERFAVVEQRQIAHVQRQHAARRLLVDDDGDRTAFDAFAEGDAATAGESCVRESFQHRLRIISRRYSSDLICVLERLFRAHARVLRADFSVA